jgi:parallel beta-helix repeat protein
VKRHIHLAGRIGLVVGLWTVLLACGEASGLRPPVQTATAPASTAGPGLSPAPTGAGTTCATPLQALVDASPAGTTVLVPACTYRETVRIGKTLRLEGVPGTEIRGSDVWSAWEPAGERWRAGPLPPMDQFGVCSDDAPRCHWPEQVFMDGVAVQQVAANPGHGEFAVDDARHILLGDDPDGHVVEVTIRSRWVTVSAPDVTIEGIAMRHAANPPQAEHGALLVEPAGRGFTLRGSDLAEAHGTLLGILRADNVLVERSTLRSAGQLGLGAWEAADVTIREVDLHDNNTEGFDPGWEAGGVKVQGSLRTRLEGNRVHDNDGPGLWCDVDCRDTIIEGNTVFANTGAGILFEISDGATIRGNTVWACGGGFSDWGFGGGIVVSSSSHVTVTDNLVAWNGDGITVISQDRGEARWRAVVGVRVKDNDVVATEDPTDPWNRLALGWLQDWQGVLFDPASANSGAGNRYWYPTREGALARFAWSGALRSLDAFNRTPGEEGGRYMTEREKTELLVAAAVPPEPPPGG